MHVQSEDEYQEVHVGRVHVPLEDEYKEVHVRRVHVQSRDVPGGAREKAEECTYSQGTYQEVHVGATAEAEGRTGREGQ